MGSTLPLRVPAPPTKSSARGGGGGEEAKEGASSAAGAEAPPAAEDAAAEEGGVGSSRPVLSLLATWVNVLYEAHGRVGGHLRALLGHPGASTVITALLTRGEKEKEALVGLAESGAASNKEVSALEEWKVATEALGAAFMDGGEEST